VVKSATENNFFLPLPIIAPTDGKIPDDSEKYIIIAKYMMIVKNAGL